MVRIDCGCGKVLKVNDSLVGKRIKCPGCGEVQLVGKAAAAVKPANKTPGPSDREENARATAKRNAPEVKQPRQANKSATRAIQDDDSGITRKSSPRKSNTVLILALVGVAMLFFLVVAAGAVYLLWPADTAAPLAKNKQTANDPKNEKPPEKTEVDAPKPTSNKKPDSPKDDKKASAAAKLDTVVINSLKQLKTKEPPAAGGLISLFQTGASEGTFTTGFAFHPRTPTFALVGPKKTELVNLLNAKATKSFAGVPGFELAAAFSPDGKLLAVGGDDKKIRLFKTTDGAIAKELPVKEPAMDLAFSADGSLLTAVLGTPGNKILASVWNTDTWMERALPHELGGKFTWEISHSGTKLLATGPFSSGLVLVDLATGEAKPIAVKGRIYGVALSGDHKTAALSLNVGETSTDNEINLLDLDTGKLTPLVKDKGYSQRISFSPDGKYLHYSIVVEQQGADRNYYQKLIDVSAAKIVWTLPRIADRARFSPGGQLLALTLGGYVELFEVAALAKQ